MGRSEPVQVTWRQEGLLFEATTAHGTIALASGLDEPGNGVTPMETLATAVASCTAMDVAAILKKMRQPLEALSVEVSGERAEEHPKRFLDFEVVYRLKGDLDESKVQRAISLSEERYCSVAATLKPGVSITSRFVSSAEGVRTTRTVLQELCPDGSIAGTIELKGRCVDRDHELSAVLADDTRYHIYRWVAEQPATDVTVADVATQFGLHPNVARMHLAKLEQAGFLTTSFRRAAGGGRPAKLYRLSDLVDTFGFPPRRYELLSRLALAALAAGGTRDAAVRVCREAGAAEGRCALAGDGEPPRDRAAAAALVASITEQQGLLPEVAWRDGVLSVVVNNCSFRELSGADPDLVCAMHRAYLEGILRVATAGLGRLAMGSDDCRISCGDARCELLCSFAAAEE